MFIVSSLPYIMAARTAGIDWNEEITPSSMYTLLEPSTKPLTSMEYTVAS